MSDDLIKRSDAIGACAYETIECYEARKAIRNLPSADRPQEDYNKGYCDAVQGIADEMVKQGKYIADDRPQGEWLKDDEGTFICSACGSGYKDQPTIMGKPMFEWCPICGARMKGADDE